jgi:hypothetical protein
MKKLTNKIITFALITAPSLVFAQQPLPTQAPQVNITSLRQVTQIIVNLVNWVIGLFFVAAILGLFYSAYNYLMAAGDPERLGTAKNALIYTIIAIVVALLATSVRFIVENILRGGTA